jgi:hypothetical protein
MFPGSSWSKGSGELVLFDYFLDRHEYADAGSTIVNY